ncbi:MAG: [Protein-PII] uridylyltransferase / [Protein-PII]-UMP uridylyl-removing enzyme, partial [uncultured Nocardioidaceae bacterium]
ARAPAGGRPRPGGADPVVPAVGRRGAPRPRRQVHRRRHGRGGGRRPRRPRAPRRSSCRRGQRGDASAPLGGPHRLAPRRPCRPPAAPRPRHRADRPGRRARARRRPGPQGVRRGASGRDGPHRDGGHLARRRAARRPRSLPAAAARRPRRPPRLRRAGVGPRGTGAVAAAGGRARPAGRRRGAAAGARPGPAGGPPLAAHLEPGRARAGRPAQRADRWAGRRPCRRPGS